MREKNKMTDLEILRWLKLADADGKIDDHGPLFMFPSELRKSGYVSGPNPDDYYYRAYRVTDKGYEFIKSNNLLALDLLLGDLRAVQQECERLRNSFPKLVSELERIASAMKAAGKVAS